MNYENYFKDVFQSVPDYRKTVLLMFSFKNDFDLINECGYLTNDIDRLNKEFKTILMEQIEDHLQYNENQEESIIGRILKKQMEAYFSNLFEELRYERNLVLLLSLTDPNILQRSKFTDDEINMVENLALEKVHRQRMLKEYFALQLLE